MSGNNYQKVSNWKIILVLMVIVWMFNIMMSFVYKSQINFFMFTWMTNVFLSLVETLLLAILCWFFYLMFFKNKKKDSNDIQKPTDNNGVQ